MARVTSHKTRQAILVIGDPLDGSMEVDRIQLFNEIGEPLSLGAGSARFSHAEPTAVLASFATETNDLDLASSLRLFRISTNVPARVRVYPSQAHRDGDLGRAIGVKAPQNSGRMLEVVTTATMLDLILSPVVDMTVVDPEDGKFYTSVTNLSGSSSAVAVTYYYFRTE